MWIALGAWSNFNVNFKKEFQQYLHSTHHHHYTQENITKIKISEYNKNKISNTQNYQNSCVI